MLVLTRKTGQSLIIGDGVEITIVEIKGDQVRIAINAPKEVPVHRKEIYELIIAENREAAQIPANLDLEKILGLKGNIEK